MICLCVKFCFRGHDRSVKKTDLPLGLRAWVPTRVPSWAITIKGKEPPRIWHGWRHPWSMGGTMGLNMDGNRTTNLVDALWKKNDKPPWFALAPNFDFGEMMQV